MSSAQSSTGESSPHYARHNWWGESDDDQDHEYTDPRDNPDNNPGVAGNWRPDPNDPASIIAHKLLRETGTMVCSTTLREEPWNGGRMAELFALLEGEEDEFERNYSMHHRNEAVELTDPAIKLPKKTPNGPDGGCERHRRRFNPDTGYINGGETTTTHIQKRPLPAFMGVVEDYLDLQGEVLFESDKQDVRNFARSLKCDPENDDNDKEMMTRVVRKVREQRNCTGSPSE